MSAKSNSLIFLILIHVSFSASAVQKNPQIRICNQLNGQFFVAESSVDQFGFCQFGSAAIGTLDLLQLKNEHQLSQAVQSYKSGQTQCQSNGQLSRFQIVGGEEMLVCVFSDGSLILNSTLEAGKNSDANHELNSALDL